MATVSWRVDFLLPLKYNNGNYIEPEKFHKAREELIKLFGGFSIHPLTIEGAWLNRVDDIIYYDECKRFEVNIEKSEANRKLLMDFKNNLKTEFKQHEIYMILDEVERI